MRISTLMIGIILLSTAVFAAFSFYYNLLTGAQNHHLLQLNEQISKTYTDIEVLQSEWSFLTRPQRLTELAEKHLGDMQVQKSEHVAYLLDLPKRNYQQDRAFAEYSTATVHLASHQEDIQADTFTEPLGLLRVGLSFFGLAEDYSSFASARLEKSVHSPPYVR